MDNNKNQCQNCRFFAKSGSKGYCHRYPPQACVVDEQGNLATLYRIPEVHENGYCGEWQSGRLEIQAHEPQMPECCKQK
jgi:hypothetical protein